MELTIQVNPQERTVRLREVHALAAGDVYNPVTLSGVAGAQTAALQLRLYKDSTASELLAQCSSFVEVQGHGSVRRGVLTLATQALKAWYESLANDATATDTNGLPSALVNAWLVVSDSTKTWAACPVPLILRAMDTNVVQGADGISPTVSLSKSGSVLTISVTDVNGTRTETVNDGEDGDPGVSPTVLVDRNPSTGSTRITIVNADGSSSSRDIVPVDPELSGLSENPVQNKVVKAALDAKANAATTYTKTEVDSLLSGKFVFVQSLPAASEADPKAIYLVPRSPGEAGNVYDEYLRVEPSSGTYAWEKVGSTDIDLSNYVQKEAGKGLFSGSYNDLSNKPTIPAAVTVDSALSDSSTNPVQNKVVKAALDGKATVAQGAKADAALSRAEAVAGFTKWAYSGLPAGATEIAYPVWNSSYLQWEFGFTYDGDSYSSNASGSETDTDLEFVCDNTTGPSQSQITVTATRTRLPTMADIPTNNAQLTNGAGYATTAAMNAALALKADASSLPYALANATQDGYTAWAYDGLPEGVTVSSNYPTYNADAGEWVLEFTYNSAIYYGMIDNSDGTELELEFECRDTDDNSVTPVTVTATRSPKYVLLDRAINAVSLSADATLVFPAQTAGKARDFVVRLTLTETNDVVPSVTFPADVAYETEGGEWPDLTEAGTYIVRLTEVPTASESETARFFLQCSSAGADATPPSAGGAS